MNHEVLAVHSDCCPTSAEVSRQWTYTRHAQTMHAMFEMHTLPVLSHIVTQGIYVVSARVLSCYILINLAFELYALPNLNTIYIQGTLLLAFDA